MQSAPWLIVLAIIIIPLSWEILSAPKSAIRARLAKAGAAASAGCGSHSLMGSAP